jgi:hypothetical protein
VQLLQPVEDQQRHYAMNGIAVELNNFDLW